MHKRTGKWTFRPTFAPVSFSSNVIIISIHLCWTPGSGIINIAIVVEVLNGNIHGLSTSDPATVLQHLFPGRSIWKNMKSVNRWKHINITANVLKTRIAGWNLSPNTYHSMALCYSGWDMFQVHSWFYRNCQFLYWIFLSKTLRYHCTHLQKEKIYIIK